MKKYSIEVNRSRYSIEEVGDDIPEKIVSGGDLYIEVAEYESIKEAQKKCILIQNRG